MQLYHHERFCKHQKIKMKKNRHFLYTDAVVLDMLYGEEPDHLEQFVRASQLNRQFRQEKVVSHLNRG